MKIRLCAALVVMMAVGTASAQLVSAHGSGGAKATASPLPVISNPHVAAAKPAQMVPAMQVTGKAVARVNGVDLIDRDLVQEMYNLFPYASQHSGFPKTLEPEIRRGALQMIIFEELVYQEAMHRHMTIPAADLATAEKEFRKQFASQEAYRQFLKTETNGSEAAMREKIRRAMLIEALLNKEINGPAQITTVQAKTEYEKDIAQYKHGEIVHIQSISLMPPSQAKAVQDEAKKRAEDALKQARQAKNYRDFGLLAEKFSDDDYRVNMGDHKPMELSMLPPPIVQALAKMKPGDVSELIAFDGNYTIVRLDARTPAGTTPFAEVKTKLQSEMQKEKTEQLRTAFAQKLRQNAKIEVL